MSYARYFDEDILNKQVFFRPPVELNEAYAFIKGADVLVSLGGDQAQRLNRKIFEYAASSRPVLHVGNIEGETARIVHLHGLGLVIPTNDLQELEAALHKFMTEEQRRRQFELLETILGILDSEGRGNLSCKLLNV